MRSLFTSFLVILVVCAQLSVSFRNPSRRIDSAGAGGLERLIAVAKQAASADDSAVISRHLEEFYASAELLAGIKPIISKCDPASPFPGPHFACLLTDHFDMAPFPDWSRVETEKTGRRSDIHFRLIRPPLA